MRMVLISSLSLILSGKWPQAVRANGHLLLNSEKVEIVEMSVSVVYVKFIMK